MDENQMNAPVSTTRRKRKLTPFERISQTYLPLLIGAVAILLILIFVVGSVVRGFQYRTLSKQVHHEASVAAQLEKERIEQEAAMLTDEAASLAKQYDYEGAIALLESFSGDRSEYPMITKLINTYNEGKATMVEWTDFTAIPNLSFELLIADPDRAFNDSANGSSFKKNFITTEEFSLILEQLYQNGYILVSHDDLYEYKTNASGVAYFVEKQLYLPMDKKPLILTQTNVNYNLYMVDSDDDMVADAGGAGFASKLVIDDNGNFACQIVNADGTLEEGAFDLIPILEAFIATHQDFSYRGARAVIALTGYNGLFGYRTHAEAEQKLDPQAYSNEVEQAKQMARALRESGYELACYTYENKDYGKLTYKQIQADMSGWTAEVVPILGQIDTFVFAKSSDLEAKDKAYDSDAYRLLEEAGFRYFLGYCKDGKPWTNVNDQYIRQGRIYVTANNLTKNKGWFTGILDPESVLVESR